MLKSGDFVLKDRVNLLEFPQLFVVFFSVNYAELIFQ